jgi:hypothetical protein
MLHQPRLISWLKGQFNKKKRKENEVMANIPSYGAGVSDWTPSTPKKSADSADKLMSTEASDAKDTMTGTNELKPWVGGSGKPAAPYGVQGRKF